MDLLLLEDRLLVIIMLLWAHTPELVLDPVPVVFLNHHHIRKGRLLNSKGLLTIIQVKALPQFFHLLLMLCLEPDPVPGPVQTLALVLYHHLVEAIAHVPK